MATTRSGTDSTTTNRFPNFDFSDLKLPTLTIPGVDTDRLLGILRDTAYVMVGFGVLTVQQIATRVRGLVGTLEENDVVKQMGVSRTQLEEIVAKWQEQFGSLDERFATLEAKLDTAVEQLEERLPEQAASVLGQAHDIAKAARKQVRGLLSQAA